MKLPNNFKSTIADVFFDKTFSLYNLVTTTETDGGTYQTPSEVIKTFKGNVRPINKETLLRDYGLDIDGEVAISTHTNIEELKQNENDMQMVDEYHIVKVLPYDSHYLLVGKTWK